MTDGGAVTVGSLFQEIMGRRTGLIKALTTDAEEFYMNCDPKKENLCLYGFPDGRWELHSAPDMVPPDHPEPAQGINFARDKMQRNHWLSFVAIQSDPWIISVAFYFGAGYGFNKADRECLFDMINDLPTIVEIVTGAMPNNDNGVELLTDRGKFSVEDVFGNFKRRQAGLIKALTTDVKKFYKLCDPKKENLWLFGYSDGRWEVDIPREEIPAEYPEPVQGINFFRDGMQQKDWLSFVARHSDAWIISLAFSFGAKFGFEKADRKLLFNMINDLPTIVEVVTGAVPENEEVGIMEVDDEEAEHEETLYAPIKFGVFSVEDVFGNFKRRQAGLIKALTTDVEKFYKLCDPKKENLCLFAYSDGRWEVDMPPEMVPASHPEPVRGINFCRDTMPYSKWLSLIAAHSDAWIISVAFSLGAEFGFGKAHRQRLFDMINDLPTISEVLTHEILYGVRQKIEISSDEEVDTESVSLVSEDEEDDLESVASNDSESEDEEDDSESGDVEDDSEAGSSDDSLRGSK